MNRMNLSGFVKEHGQEKAAQLLGVTQGAISKALKVGRDIHVTDHGDGTFSAQELKPFPAVKAKAA